MLNQSRPRQLVDECRDQPPSARPAFIAGVVICCASMALTLYGTIWLIGALISGFAAWIAGQ